MRTELTLGEYLRRLRRRKRLQLQELADKTGLSISHLSRIENDNAVITTDTVVKLHRVLGGRLEQMLELANCLPREILDRLIRRVDDDAGVLRRTTQVSQADPSFPRALITDMDPVLRQGLAERFELSERDVEGIFSVLRRLARMSQEERDHVMAFLLPGAREG